MDADTEVRNEEQEVRQLRALTGAAAANGAVPDASDHAPAGNVQAALVFLRIAEMMGYRDENNFKTRAYYRAALTLTALTTPLKEIADRNELQTLPGVGDAIAGKILEILQTGTCDLHERLRGEVSPNIQTMLRVPGLTPRLVRMLELEFNLETPQDLLDFVQRGDLSDLEGTAFKVEDAAQVLEAALALGAFAPPAHSA